MSPPFAADWFVVIVILLVGTTGLLSESKTLPEYENTEEPLPAFPSVIMYVAVTTAPFSNFLPKYPSPNSNSYFSSWTSCSK